MEDNFKDFFNESKNLVKNYGEKRLELVKLQAMLKTSQALGVFFSLLFVFFMLLLVLVFVIIWLSFWISAQTGSYTTGFGISAGILLVLFAIVALLRKKLLQQPVSDIVAREIANDDEEDVEY